MGAERQWSPRFFDGSKTTIIPLTFPSYLVEKYRSYQELGQFKDPRTPDHVTPTRTRENMSVLSGIPTLSDDQELILVITS